MKHDPSYIHIRTASQLLAKLKCYKVLYFATDYLMSAACTYQHHFPLHDANISMDPLETAERACVHCLQSPTSILGLASDEDDQVVLEKAASYNILHFRATAQTLES